MTASADLRADLEALTDFNLITACAALAGADDLADPGHAMHHVLGALARRWLQLHDEIKIHSGHLKRLTKTAAPELVAAFGIGPDIAAEMLITAGDNNDRIRSDAALAKLCGACPIRASAPWQNRSTASTRPSARSPEGRGATRLILRLARPSGWSSSTSGGFIRRSTECRLPSSRQPSGLGRWPRIRHRDAMTASFWLRPVAPTRAREVLHIRA